MTDAPDDLAQRYLTLWTQYLTALLANPQAMEMLKRWTALTGQFAYPAAGTAPAGGMPSAPPGAAGAAAAPDDRIAALARRVEELERRLAALEHPAKPRRRTAAR